MISRLRIMERNTTAIEVEVHLMYVGNSLLLVSGRGSIPHTCAAVFPLLYQFCCACACCSVDQVCIHSWL